MSAPHDVIDPGWRRRAVELLALAPLAVAQPLFEVLTHGADFFVAHDSRGADLVAFAVVVYLGPVLLVLAATRATRWLGPSSGRWTHHLGLALFAAALVAPWLDRARAPAPLCVGGALVAGTGIALAIRRLAGARLLLCVLAPLTLVIPLVFLFFSPVAELVRGASVEPLDIEIGNPAPVVVVVLDELPLTSLLDADHTIDAERFPSFARLAARSHWFPDATSVSPVTNEAVPAILTGMYPEGGGAATASRYPRSLFTLLGSRYDLEVVETQTDLCPDELCPDTGTGGRGAGFARLLTDASIVYLHIVTPTDWRQSLPSISGTWTDFLAPQDLAAVSSVPAETSADLDLHIHAADREEVFEEFLDRVGTPSSSGRPGLYFLHVMLPHIPWVYLPSGKEYWGSLYSSSFAEGVGRDTVWTTARWQVTQGYQRHLLQVAFVDRLLGRLLDRLEATGLFDEALLVVTADHGLSFRPGEPGRRVTPRNFGDVMSIPLFVHTPGQTTASVDRRNVEIVDILPTVADVLRIELPYPVDGQSMLSGAPRRRDKVLLDDGKRLRYRPEELTMLDESLSTKLDLFRDGLFRIGPDPQLIGRPVAALDVGAECDVEVRLDQAEQYRRVDLGGGYLPAQIFGRARRPSASGPLDLEIALAVNGVVRAVTRTFEDHGTRFAAMVPEQSFVQGPNHIQVFVVDSASGRTVLRPVRRNAAPTYSLERSGDGDVSALAASDGSRCRLVEDAVEGAYYRYGTGFMGWARASDDPQRYVIIMTFVDGRLVYTISTGVAPPAEAPVASRPGYETSGFRFVLPAAILDEARDVRLFAVLGDRGSELRPRTGASR